MDDLISRKALIEEVRKMRLIVRSSDDPFDVVRTQGRMFRKAVDEAPAVDAVEVIRCKDCRYYSPDTLACTLSYSPIPPSPNWYPEDFCSYGERESK